MIAWRAEKTRIDERLWGLKRAEMTDERSCRAEGHCRGGVGEKLGTREYWNAGEWRKKKDCLPPSIFSASLPTTLSPGISQNCALLFSLPVSSIFLPLLSVFLFTAWCAALFYTSPHPLSSPFFPSLIFEFLSSRTHRFTSRAFYSFGLLSVDRFWKIPHSPNFSTSLSFFLLSRFNSRIQRARALKFQRREGREMEFGSGFGRLKQILLNREILNVEICNFEQFFFSNSSQKLKNAI